ncbi:hypothetical protein NSA47_01900 [Irregularibacter muris]|uniref:Uncharacterized protein n=1 Tax=Irregularibacter muris TaxID=1796619 RepID=A0AAE3HCT5_9FIRM|nr:hypothetical protein [Irregularibacter muris]
MEMICPLCNGLKNLANPCPNCHGQMTDKGPIENFYDDYSAYLDKNITQRLDNADPNYCVHLFQCDICGKDKRMSIDREMF